MDVQVDLHQIPQVARHTQVLLALPVKKIVAPSNEPRPCHRFIVCLKLMA